MKGDFSRIRFNPAKQYTSVLKQQGRVDLDSDSNEQCFIDENIRDTINLDVIGRYGCPETSPGFAIRIVGDSIEIGAGRYYVNGILVENSRPRGYDHQPYLIESRFTAQELVEQLIEAGAGASLGIVLEVWQRLVTALDDPCLLEPALGQADTTARLQTVWRVVGAVSTPSDNKAVPRILEKNLDIIDRGVLTAKPGQGLETIDIGGDQPALFNPISELSPCCQNLYDGILVDRSGSMRASLASGGNDCGCQPVAAAGYQGLENQLYRVEIHQGGDLSSATFKWSRENASVVTAVTSVGANSPIITVAGLGPDANLGFQPGQWVELTDDSYQFGDTPNQHGLLFKILYVSQATLQVTMTTPVFGIDTTLNARMRRWDQAGDSITSSGIPVSSTPIPLENGIQVDFRAGQYQPGDYWLIPARTASGQIDWPPCGGNGHPYQRASFAQVYRAPLACIGLRTDANLSSEQKAGSNFTAEGRFLINDCRLFFPPLTAVNTQTIPNALHVTGVTWNNDDVMTVDTLLANGFSVTFDQPTTCPWGGGNFEVKIEPPIAPGAALTFWEGKLPGIPNPTFASPLGTDCFVRTVVALDPPFGIDVNGNTVSWFPAVSLTGQVNYGAYEILGTLNTMLLWTAPIGFGRVRVRLIGGAVYGTDANGNNIYLDGESLGSTTNRSLDNSEAISLNTPSGDSFAVSDYESWFYLAPTVFVTSVVIQGVASNGQIVNNPLTAVRVIVNANNQITGFQSGESLTISTIQAVITLSYPPVSPTIVNLNFNPVSGPTASSVASIASSVQIPAGQQTFTTPISILSNPGSGNTDVVSLVASVKILWSQIPVSSPPQLSIAGTAPPGGGFTVPVAPTLPTLQGVNVNVK